MTNKLKYFVGNWKMFGDFSSLKNIYKVNSFVKNFKKGSFKNRIIFCVPSTLIRFFTDKFKSNVVSIGAQNCHYEDSNGPFTGSINATMIKKAGAKYVILGHSENRKEGDTGKLINKKITSALKKNIVVIFCIGEKYNEKKSGKTYSVIKKQIKDSVSQKHNLKKIIFAYEPVWSIGTGVVPGISQLKNIFKFIKKELKKDFKKCNNPTVLYGGSVNSKNIRLFSKIPEIDGFLIGGASQSSKKFIDIIKNYYK